MNFEYSVREMQGTGGSALIDVLKGIFFYRNVLRGAGASALTCGYRP